MINYALSKLKRNGKGKVNCRFLIYGSVSITTLTSSVHSVMYLRHGSASTAIRTCSTILDIKYEYSIAADNQREN